MVPDPRHLDDDADGPDSTAVADRSRRRHDGSHDVDTHPASTLMIEIDGFDAVARAKRRNKILDQVSWVVTDTLRSTDVVYRRGDSGFCAVLPSTPVEQALGAAGRVRANVESMPLLANAGITVTVGVAAGGETDLGETIARAERALEGTTGSNRVVCADGPDDAPRS